MFGNYVIFHLYFDRCLPLSFYKGITSRRTEHNKQDNWVIRYIYLFMENLDGAQVLKKNRRKTVNNGAML